MPRLFFVHFILSGFSLGSRREAQMCIYREVVDGREVWYWCTYETDLEEYKYLPETCLIATDP